MTLSRLACFALPLLALAACATRTTSAPVPARAPVETGWRAIATEADRARLREIRSAWRDGLTQARTTSQDTIAGDVELFSPDAALLSPLPPAGDYHCRTIKLGTQGGGGTPFIAYPAFRCRVSANGNLVNLTKLTGSQRPIGTIYPDNPRRAVFLGTLQLGDERLALTYGRDRERNLIGAVERIGPRRWRVAFPSPAFESRIDLLDLVPMNGDSR